MDLDALARLAALYGKSGATTWGGNRRSREFKRAGTDSVAAKLAKLTGQSQRAIRRKLLIAEKATANLKTALADGKVSQNVAETLLSQSAEEQDRSVERLVAKHATLRPRAPRRPGATALPAVGRYNKAVSEFGIDEVRRRLAEDPDFVCLPQYGYSLAKVMETFPNGVPDALLQQALLLSPAEAEAMHAAIVKELRHHMKVK